MLVDVIIPAHNEGKAIADVLKEIPRELVRECIVVSNASTDDTEQNARTAGAKVLTAKQKGYGNACLKGIQYLKTRKLPPDIVVFLDGDHSDFPGEMPRLIKPITDGNCDMVIGSRALGNRERGSMTPQQLFGNRLATFLLKLFYKEKSTDLGPFRAIRFRKLLALEMADRNYGWTVEMQIKAAKLGFKTCEVPVSYRKRIGKSKVSGTFKGSVLAGYKIILTLLKNI